MGMGTAGMRVNWVPGWHEFRTLALRGNPRRSCWVARILFRCSGHSAAQAYMNHVKLEIYTHTKQPTNSIERAAHGRDDERQLSWDRRGKRSILEIIDITQMIEGNAAFHVWPYRGLEKMILDGHREFPAMAGRRWRCSSPLGYTP
jgi:hypothetical protein